MDDGYRLLQHVVRQVFGNLGQAARLTLFLTVAPMLVILYLMSQTVPGPGGIPTPENPGLIILMLILNLLTSAWAAVGWHRYVLREEYGNGLVPHWHGGNVGAYIWRLIVLALVMIAIGIGIGLAFAAIVATTQSAAIAMLLGIGMTIGFSWLAIRIGLILPAAALGEPMTIGQSWEATRPISTDILVPVVVLALAVAVVDGAITALFGVTMIGILALAVLYWMQILLNLSLMTTVYGIQVEGRSLR